MEKEKRRKGATKRVKRQTKKETNSARVMKDKTGSEKK